MKFDFCIFKPLKTKNQKNYEFISWNQNRTKLIKSICR